MSFSHRPVSDEFDFYEVPHTYDFVSDQSYTSFLNGNLSIVLELAS